MIRRIFLLLFIGLGLVQSTFVYASETLFEYQLDSNGQFLSKSADQTYIPVFLPTHSGILYSEIMTRYLFRDGCMEMGLEIEKATIIDYNLSAGQVLYYTLKKAKLPNEYNGISGSYVKYTRKNLLMGVSLLHKNWDLNTGCKVIQGTSLFKIDIKDGQAVNADDAILGYDIKANSVFWQGYAEDLGLGLGCYFNLKYHPTEKITISFSGDDLFSSIVWKGIDEYHGKIDLDFIQPDAEGIPSLKPPVSGVYIPDCTLKVDIRPEWIGKIDYHKDSYKIENWVRYNNSWEVGVKGTLHLKRVPDFSFGLVRQTEFWTYFLGMNMENFQVDLAANSINLHKVTQLQFGVRIYLY